MSFERKITTGQTIKASDLRKWLGDFLENKIATGFVVTADEGLDINISEGRAYVKDENGEMFQINLSEEITETMQNDTINYIYLHANDIEFITVSESADVPIGAMKIAEVETEDGEIKTIE